MKEISISDEAYAWLENTASVNHMEVPAFVEMIGNHFQLPEGQHGMIMHRQVLRRMPEDLVNLRHNLGHILNCKSVALIEAVEAAVQGSKAALVIANGPSLSDEQLETFKASEFRQRGGLTLCVDSALKRVLRVGIVPDFVVLLDNQLFAKEFFTDPVVDKYNKRLKYIVPTDMHPEVVELLRGELYFYQSARPPYPSINLNMYLNYMFPDIPMLDSGGNVGVFSIILAYYLKKDWIATIGLDFSWPGHTKHEETENFFLDVLDHGGSVIYGPNGEYQCVQWPCGTDRCLSPTCAKRRETEPEYSECQQALDSQFVHVTDPFGNDRVIDCIYDLYVDLLTERVKNMQKERPEQRFFNCSGAGLAYPEGMERISLQDYFDLLGV